MTKYFTIVKTALCAAKDMYLHMYALLPLGVFFLCLIQLLKCTNWPCHSLCQLKFLVRSYMHTKYFCFFIQIHIKRPFSTITVMNFLTVYMQKYGTATMNAKSMLPEIYCNAVKICWNNYTDLQWDWDSKLSNLTANFKTTCFMRRSTA